MTAEEDLGQLRRDVDRLRAEMGELRSRVAGEQMAIGNVQVLAAGADREASETGAALRAHAKTLEALRATQLEQAEALRRLEVTVGDLRGKVDTGFAELQNGMTTIISMLQRLGPEQPS